MTPDEQQKRIEFLEAENAKLKKPEPRRVEKPGYYIAYGPQWNPSWQIVRVHFPGPGERPIVTVCGEAVGYHLENFEFHDGPLTRKKAT